MDFRCREGTSEDQRVRRGVRLRRCLQGKDERSPISRKSAGLETAANRKRSRRRERPKKMKITPLLCLRLKPPNQEYLLFFWENQTAADQGSLSAMSARFRAKFVVCHLCQALRPREQLLLLGLSLSCFTVPPSFFFLTSSSRTLLCCALCFPVSHYKVFLEQVGYINFKIEGS